jgi:nucleotide-binding universal stress UspA family protein
MLQKILVALDHSDHAALVFDTALTLAKATGGQLMLLHVLSSTDETSPRFPMMTSYYSSGYNNGNFEIYQELWQQYEAKGLEMLRSYTLIANTAGVSTEFSQNIGSPDRMICQLAQDLGSDLIVTGRRGHSDFNELILGSVSSYVMHHAPCSTLIVHRTPPEPKAEPAQ